MLVCHLPRQEERLGHTSHLFELWVERVMQYVKSCVKYRITAHPESLFVGEKLIDDALGRCAPTPARPGGFGRACDRFALSAGREGGSCKCGGDGRVGAGAGTAAAPPCLASRLHYAPPTNTFCPTHPPTAG